MEYTLFMLLINCLTPIFLSTVCNPIAENPGHHYRRSAVRGDLVVPVTRTVQYSPHCLAVAEPSIWIMLVHSPHVCCSCLGRTDV